MNDVETKVQHTLFCSGQGDHAYEPGAYSVCRRCGGEHPQSGTKVKISLPSDADLLKTAWWPKGEVTGTVQKVFKNGKVAVAVDQLYNRSDDMRQTIHFDATDLAKLEGSQR